MRASRFFFILLMSQVVPTDAPVPSVDLRTRVLADGWVIDSFASNSAGTVVVAGGQRPRLPNGELVLVGLNDGLFMVQTTRFLWLVGKGDLLPGRPDLRFRSFAGIP